MHQQNAINRSLAPHWRNWLILNTYSSCCCHEFKLSKKLGITMSMWDVIAELFLDNCSGENYLPLFSI